MYREAKAHFTHTERWFSAKGRRFDYEEGLGPYEYLMGALAGCFTSTLLDELAAAGVEVGDIDVHCYGRKRESVPTTLEETFIDLSVHAPAESAEAILEAVGKTKEHCSIYQTIRCVSTMHVSCEVVK